MTTKVCIKCSDVKPLAEFSQYKKTGKVYINGLCRSCDNARTRKWRNENKERYESSKNKSNTKHKEKRYTASKLWRTKNKDKIKEWLVTHVDSGNGKSYQKRWRAENKDNKYKNQYRRQAIELTDNYLLSLLYSMHKILFSELKKIPYLIEAKRELIKIHRATKQNKI